MYTRHRRSPRTICQISARGLQFLAIVLVAVAISYLAMLVFFQFVYPHFVRGAIEGMLQSPYGAADLDASADTRFAQGFMFLDGALLSLTGTIIVSPAAYFIVTRAQEKATETALDIERRRLLHELDSESDDVRGSPSRSRRCWTICETGSTRRCSPRRVGEAGVTTWRQCCIPGP